MTLLMCLEFTSVHTSVGLVSCFYDTILGIYNENFPFFVTIRCLMVLLFSIPFESVYHARTFIPMQNHSSINMVWNGIDPNSNSGIQRISHLEAPTEYQYLTGITNLIPTGRFFDTISDVGHQFHACTDVYVRPTLVHTS